MEEFQKEFNDENSIIKLDCNHYFHHKCLETWILRKRTCPICRVETDFMDDTRKRKLSNVDFNFRNNYSIEDDADY